MHIILVEPSHPGNIGAIARVMKNFGFSSLTLVNPRCETNQETRNRAKHAQDIIDTITITNSLPKLETLIATTSQLGTDYNIPRSPITPAQLKTVLSDHNNIGIVFGREGEGLHNIEIQQCDFVLTIPSHPEYPTLNLSHSVAIVCYEIFQCTKNKSSDHYIPASRQDKEQIMKLLEVNLQNQEYATEEKRDTQRKVWKRILGKSFLTKREAFALMGFMKKIN